LRNFLFLFTFPSSSLLFPARLHFSLLLFTFPCSSLLLVAPFHFPSLVFTFPHSSSIFLARRRRSWSAVYKWYTRNVDLCNLCNFSLFLLTFHCSSCKIDHLSDRLYSFGFLKWIKIRNVAKRQGRKV